MSHASDTTLPPIVNCQKGEASAFVSTGRAFATWKASAQGLNRSCGIYTRAEGQRCFTVAYVWPGMLAVITETERKGYATTIVLLCAVRWVRLNNTHNTRFVTERGIYDWKLQNRWDNQRPNCCFHGAIRCFR